MNGIVFKEIYYGCLSFEAEISDGVYTFLLDGTFLSYIDGNFIQSYIFGKGSLFRILSIRFSLNDNSFYNIEEINTKFKLSLSENKELTFNNIINHSENWRFIRLENNYFVIKNKNYQCYIKKNKVKYICDNISLDKATKFKLIKIFNEVKEFQFRIDKELFDREPVDILIKYIDLKDKKLKRREIHQIEKDYDNEELRYSIRSIINYIPWVRKIFILMPNKKVRFFKKYSLIKDKIVYVKDKDFLGYDSSNSYAFQFRYWKMKEFGISNNIIVMDDDYFIGSKLEKTDFFYIEDGKVVPFIVTSNFEMINKSYVLQKIELYSNKVRTSRLEQTGVIFQFSMFLTLSFLLDLFNISEKENIFIPKFTHNAIPINLKDLKEIYKIIYNSKFKNQTLDCLYRSNETLQFQIFVTVYTFIKYGRKVKNIPCNYIKIERALFANYNYPLFCINKGAFHYKNIIYKKAKIVMEYLFPNPSPYEIINYNVRNLSFIVSKYLEKSLKKTTKQYNNKLSIKNREFFYFQLLNFLFLFVLFIKNNFRFEQNKFLYI